MPHAKPIQNNMKSYNDLLKQIWRIDAIWSSVDFSPSMDMHYDRACKLFYHYKYNMQQHLARFNDEGNDAGKGGYWAAVWERNKDTKVPRSIYVGD